MAYFLLQQRRIRPINDVKLTFPAVLQAKVRFGPEDAFGVPGVPRTTGKRATPASILFNLDEGTTTWEGDLIDELGASLQVGDLNVEWSGNELKLSVEVNSQDEASQLIHSANQMLPAFLSFRLRVFVWIKEFLVEIGKSSFRFGTFPYQYSFIAATTERNQEMVNRAIRDWMAVRPESLRIVMAIYYFRHAVRLANLEPADQSMTAEVILNLSKAIEIIFSPDRDRLRSRAKEWGFDSTFIEEKIVPILLMRSKLDVAHVATGPLSFAQHQTILRFTSMALVHVSSLISRIVEMSQSGDIELDPVSESLDKEKADLLQKIAEYAEPE